MDPITKLKNIDCSKVPRFSFEGIETYARVAKIYDPDTITIVFEQFGQMIKLNIRLDGIDAPELKSKIEAESNACKQGIQRMKELVEDKVVYVFLNKYDKYGRILARVQTLEPIEEGLSCINDYLLKYRYVRTYDGGKKVEWTQDDLNVIGKKL